MPGTAPDPAGALPGGGGAASLPPDDALRTLAEEILSQPEYVRLRPVDPDGLRRLLEPLQRLLDWLDGLHVESPLLYWALLLGLLLVAAGLLAHVTLALRAALAVRARPEPSPRAMPVSLRFRDEAEALARSGRFLEAAHRLQLACIDLCLERGALELRRFEPNRTLRRRLERSTLAPEARREFVALVDRLERAWFRDRRAEQGLYEAWRALDRRLRAEAGGPGPRPA